MKIIVVFGTRPEAIKMAPVVKALRGRAGVSLVTCVTGQHRSMLDQVLDIFGIVPDHDLNIMKPNQDLSQITTNVLVELGKVLALEKPDLVLVHGDTTTAMAAAMAAFYQRIAVGHVEAGLRTDNLYRPWPEEMNRRVIDVMAQHFFTPTERARQALLREGQDEARICVTGNTVVDALHEVAGRLDDDAGLRAALDRRFSFLDGERRLVLVTGHRRESFGQPLENICRALAEIAQRDDVEILYPVHLNENVKGPVHRLLGGTENVHLTEPVDYLTFVYLLKRSFLIVTDSGGIQEEAPALGKPVLITRDVTERPEGVEAGTARLVGADYPRIVVETTLLLDDAGAYERMSRAINPFGDGTAAIKIADWILR